MSSKFKYNKFLYKDEEKTISWFLSLSRSEKEQLKGNIFCYECKVDLTFSNVLTNDGKKRYYLKVLGTNEHNLNCQYKNEFVDKDITVTDDKTIDEIKNNPKNKNQIINIIKKSIINFEEKSNNKKIKNTNNHEEDFSLIELTNKSNISKQKTINKRIRKLKITEEFFSDESIKDKVFILYKNNPSNFYINEVKQIKDSSKRSWYFKLFNKSENSVIVFLNNWDEKIFEKKQLKPGFNEGIQYLIFCGLIKKNKLDSEDKENNKAKWRVELLDPFNYIEISKKLNK